jgi:transposase
LKSTGGDRRKDWVEKTDTDLPGRFDVIRLENLNVKAMTVSARATMQHPGRNLQGRPDPGHPQVRLGSARARQLEQKAPAGSRKSKLLARRKTCNPCQHIAAQSPTSQAGFVCVACGRAANPDVNAA